MIHLKLNIVPGNVAPRYSQEVCDRELTLQSVVVTERGTAEGLPIVDFVLTDKEGKEYFFATTGRIVTSIASAVRGVNQRNHGNSDP